MQNARVPATNNGRGLLYTCKGPLQVQGVCDAAFACHIDDRRSQGGYLFLMGGAAISWKSYTISTVARLTPESEYVAAWDVGAEAIFLRNFLGELGFPQPGATPIFTNSTGAQAIINNPCNRARTKHIKIHYHYARQHVAAGRLDYRKVKSSENSRDVLTKPLPRAAHLYCSLMMGLDVEASKAFDLSALPRDSRSRRKGSPLP